MNANISYIERQIVSFRKKFEEAERNGNEELRSKFGVELGNYREMLADELNKAKEAGKVSTVKLW